MNTWKKHLTVMWIVQFCGFLTVTFITTFIPLYVKHLGVKGHDAISLWSGILMGGAAFTAFFSGPIWGNIGDRYGRKAMLVRVLVSNTIIATLMAVVTNIWQFLVLRLIQGMLGGVMAASTALVTSLIPKQHSGYALGIFQSASTIGAAFGPFLGGVIADTFGARWAFIFVGASTLSAAILINLFIKVNPKGHTPAAESSFWEALKVILKNRSLVAMMVVNFLLQFSMMIISPILPLYVESLGANKHYLASISGFTIAIGGVFSAVAAILIGKISDRVGYRKILLILLSISGLLHLGYMFIWNIPQLFVLRIITGFTLGGVLPTSNALINSIIPEERKGTAFGVTTSFFLLGNVLGPISGGAIAALLGLKSVFLFTGIILVAISFWVASVVKTQQKVRVN